MERAHSTLFLFWGEANKARIRSISGIGPSYRRWREFKLS